MGFFSSLGGILGGVAGSLIAPGIGTVIGAGLGSTVGGGVDSNKAAKTKQGYYNNQMDLAKQQMQFQQDYVKSVMQWRVEDAKKAGVHPMAALGMSNPGYSPVSLPSIPSSAGTDASLNPMEFGQSLNYAATKAKDRQQQAQMVDLQIRGLELDNEYKQAMINQTKVDTLASSIASNQALGSPAAPTFTPESQHVPGQADSGDTSILGKGSHRLFNIAMHGDSAVLVLNPEISDGVSESMVSNTIASIVREIETGNNPDLVDEIISHFPKGIRRAIANGEMRLASIPGSGAFRAVPVGPNESFNRYNVFGIN